MGVLEGEGGGGAILPRLGAKVVVEAGAGGHGLGVEVGGERAVLHKITHCSSQSPKSYCVAHFRSLLSSHGLRPAPPASLRAGGEASAFLAVSASGHRARTNRPPLRPSIRWPFPQGPASRLPREAPDLSKIRPTCLQAVSEHRPSHPASPRGSHATHILPASTSCASTDFRVLPPFRRLGRPACQRQTPGRGVLCTFSPAPPTTARCL